MRPAKPLYLSLILLLASPGFINGTDKNLPTLSVRGSATLSKPADELSLSIGITSQARTAELALKDNNSQMAEIIDVLEEAGLKKEDYQTGRFTIRPMYSQPPKSPAPNWTPEIVGYEAENSVVIRTDKIDLAGELIDIVTKAGANQIGNIRFGLKNPRKYRAEAIAAATQNALEDAKVLAKAANAGLVQITQISLDDAAPAEIMPRMQLYAKSSASDTTPIEPGNVEVQASVAIQFEIQP